MRKLSLKMTVRLRHFLEQRSDIECSDELRFAVWILEIVLEIAQSEPRLRMSPTRSDPGPACGQSETLMLMPELFEFLSNYAYEMNRTVSFQAREFLWIGLEAHAILVKRQHLFRREELKKRIAQHLEQQFLPRVVQ